MENYCPLNEVAGQYSDSKKKFYAPLFTSYVFVHVSEKQQAELKRVPGIINLVLWLNRPAVIRDSEIQAIKEFIAKHKTVHLERALINLNETATEVSDPYLAFDGNANTIKSNYLKIVLPSLGYLMCAEVQESKEVVVGFDVSFVNNSSYQFA